MNEIRYSIIIPHKNSFGLLLRLLQTIPDRKVFEVIIVDDNSNSQEKSKFQKHSFNENVILIFNKRSEGAGKARNIALKRVSGKWIIFADADDFFTDKLNFLLEEHYNSPQDIIYFGTNSIFNDTEFEANRHERYMSLVSEYIKNNKNEDSLRYFYTPPWGKMIRTEIVIKNNIHFEEIIASNDIHFSLKLAYHAKSITASHEVLYIITVSPGSLTNSFSYNHFDAKFNAALRANKFLCSINKKKHQQSILYFLAKSYKFGIEYLLVVIYRLIKNRSNIFIGFEKVINYKKVLNQRENMKYLVKKD
tara:strand:- start:3466 stop:4383 length:918 start_codon:yes stop_codon:yes gene_type:complete